MNIAVIKKLYDSVETKTRKQTVRTLIMNMNVNVVFVCLFFREDK